MPSIEELKKLEYLVAFQAECLRKGKWDEFDKAETEIRKLEKTMLECGQNRHVKL